MVSILRLDGRRFRGARTTIAVLPGEHVLQLRWHKMQSPYYLGMDVQADTYHWRPIASGTVTVEVDLYEVALFAPYFLPDSTLLTKANMSTERYEGFFEQR